MLNITTVKLRKYGKTRKYEDVGYGIFRDLKNGRFVVTLRFELEQFDSFQYPLENILDKFSVNCTKHIKTETKGRKRFLEVEFEDATDNNFSSYNKIAQLTSMVGRRAYNKLENGYTIFAIE